MLKDDMVENIPERLGKGQDHVGGSWRCRNGSVDGNKLLPDVLSCMGGTKSKYENQLKIASQFLSNHMIHINKKFKKNVANKQFVIFYY